MNALLLGKNEGLPRGAATGLRPARHTYSGGHVDPGDPRCGLCRSAAFKDCPAVSQEGMALRQLFRSRAICTFFPGGLYL